MRLNRAPNDGSKPPPAAVFVFVAIVFGAPILATALGFFGIDWRSFLPWSDSENWYIAAIFAPIPILLIVALVTKLWEAKRASKWAQTSGKILKSTVEARHHQFSGEAETVKNVPAVEYAFSAGGKDYRGARIGIGDVGGEDTDAVLARYPVGKNVTVFYDPSDPNECVLEREVPKGIVPGCLGMLAAGAAAVAGIYYATTNATRILGNHIDNAPFVVAISCFGIAVLFFLWGYRRYVKSTQNWPTAPGKVVESRVESYEKRDDGKLRTIHAPLVEYVYRVHDREYRNRQIRLGMTVEGSEMFAQKTIARYPKGASVIVHYDPANASNAALEGPGGYPWIMLAAALFCFVVAAIASGIFR